jgi:hypothetical protein
MTYKCEADSPEAVVQLIAASYLRHGYYWYVTGTIPDRKDPREVDRKLIDKYDIDLSDWERSRRKKRGIAGVHYLRHDRWFILMATEGHHPLKSPASAGGEKEQLRDCRRVPIRFRGYSISYRRAGVTPKGASGPKWHAHVRIDQRTYLDLKAYFLDHACHRSPENLAREFSQIPFARYAPVRRQLLTLLRQVNDARDRIGFQRLPHTVLQLRRVPVKVYREHEPDPETGGIPLGEPRYDRQATSTPIPGTLEGERGCQPRLVGGGESPVAIVPQGILATVGEDDVVE